MSDQDNNGNAPKRPEAVIRDGNMSATMWRNEGKYGDRFTTTLEKSYKDEQDQWRTTNQLSGTDLLRGSNLLGEAYQKETELKREQSLARSQNREVEQARGAYSKQSAKAEPTQEHVHTIAPTRDK